MWLEAYNHTLSFPCMWLWALVSENNPTQGLVSYGGYLALECLVSLQGCL